MTHLEILKIKSLLEGNYPSLAKQEDMIYLSTLQDYDYKAMLRAVENIIVREKFPPNIAVILEEYKRVSSQKYLKIIEGMNNAGLFYHPTELNKAMKWAEKGYFPDWFRQMMVDFVKGQNKQIGTKKKQLEGVI